MLQRILSEKRPDIHSAFSESRYATPCTDHSVPGSHPRCRVHPVHRRTRVPHPVARIDCSHTHADEPTDRSAGSRQQECEPSTKGVHKAVIAREKTRIVTDENACCRSSLPDVLPDASCTAAAITRTTPRPVTDGVDERTSAVVARCRVAARNRAGEQRYLCLHSAPTGRNVLLPDLGEAEKRLPCQKSRGLYNFDLYKDLSQRRFGQLTPGYMTSELALRRRRREMELTHKPRFLYCLYDEGGVLRERDARKNDGVDTVARTHPIEPVARTPVEMVAKSPADTNTAITTDNGPRRSTTCQPLLPLPPKQRRLSCEWLAVTEVVEATTVSRAESNQSVQSTPEPSAPSSRAFSAVNRTVMERFYYPARSYNHCRSIVALTSTADTALMRQRQLHEREQLVEKCRVEDIKLVHNLPK